MFVCFFTFLWSGDFKPLPACTGQKAGERNPGSAVNQSQGCRTVTGTFLDMCNLVHSVYLICVGELGETAAPGGNLHFHPYH